MKNAIDKQIDVVAIGELLIDFTPLPAADGKACYERNPGGAPANVLVMLEHLGKKTAIISKVGCDSFGLYLKSVLESENVDTSGLTISRDYPTTLAFVTLNADGDRDFSFFRKYSADVMLTLNEINHGLIDSALVLHFGSVSLTAEPSRTATLETVSYAKASGKMISYDPNYRPLLWRSERDALAEMRAALDYADIVKISDSELELLCGEPDAEKGAKMILNRGAQFVFVTLGADGCYYAAANGESGHVPGYKVDAIDTTGAGDTFCGAALSGLLDCNFKPEKGRLREIVSFANAAAALNSTRRGAIPAMPYENDINVIRK